MSTNEVNKFAATALFDTGRGEVGGSLVRAAIASNAPADNEKRLLTDQAVNGLVTQRQNIPRQLGWHWWFHASSQECVTVVDITARPPFQSNAKTEIARSVILPADRQTGHHFSIHFSLSHSAVPQHSLDIW